MSCHIAAFAICLGATNTWLSNHSYYTISSLYIGWLKKKNWTKEKRSLKIIHVCCRYIWFILDPTLVLHALTDNFLKRLKLFNSLQYHNQLGISWICVCMYVCMYVNIWHHSCMYVNIWHHSSMYVNIWHHSSMYVNIWHHSSMNVKSFKYVCKYMTSFNITTAITIH